MSRIQLDTSEVGRADLRARLLASVRSMGYAVEDCTGFWPTLLSGETPTRAERELVVCDLARLATHFETTGHHEWVSAVRKLKPLFVALVRTQKDVRYVALVDDLVRLSDSRVWVCEPDDEEGGMRRCLGQALAAMEPLALVEVRYSTLADQLWVQFGDGFAAQVGWDELGMEDLVAECLDPESAIVGSRGTTVELAKRDGGLFEIDSASIRALLDQGHAERLRQQAEIAEATVGERLRSSRRAAGLTQIDLSERTGLDQAVISRLERGRHRPRFDTLQRIAAGLGISVAHLLAA